jgi:N-acetylmuramoyl-L-alanine amidase
LVVIDPGHGGKKPGAVSPHDGTLEKDLNLQVSQILGGKLSELGLATQYTRFEDTHIKLADRADIANTQKANLLLSVHFNSSERGAPTGMEIFRNLEGVDFSVSLGKDLCKWGDHVGLAFRGVKNGDHLKVLRLCERPSVLLECGFMNSRNNSDVETVMREVESFTDAVANSVAAYLQGES